MPFGKKDLHWTLLSPSEPLLTISIAAVTLIAAHFQIILKVMYPQVSSPASFLLLFLPPLLSFLLIILSSLLFSEASLKHDTEVIHHFVSPIWKYKKMWCLSLRCVYNYLTLATRDVQQRSSTRQRWPIMKMMIVGGGIWLVIAAFGQHPELGLFSLQQHAVQSIDVRRDKSLALKSHSDVWISYTHIWLI